MHHGLLGPWTFGALGLGTDALFLRKGIHENCVGWEYHPKELCVGKMVLKNFDFVQILENCVLEHVVRKTLVENKSSRSMCAWRRRPQDLAFWGN